MWYKFSYGTPPFCKHSSILYNVLNPSSLALNHCSYLHNEVYNDPVQHLMQNSLDPCKNVNLECINSLGIVGIDQACPTQKAN